MGHTVGFEGVERYWKYFEPDTKHTDLLSEIKKKWFALHRKKIIKRMDFLFDGKQMVIDDQVSITCLSPSPAELLEYQKRIKFTTENDERELK